MPRRQRTRRIPSVSVQGSGSWVEIRQFTVSEQEDIRAMSAQVEAGELDKSALEDTAREMMADRILAWNWVDDDGTDMPLPKEDMEIFGLLTSEEMAFLGRALNGTTEQANRKN